MIERTAGATIYIQDELSEARVCVDELKHYIVQALDLVNKSNKKEHFYATAGEIIHAVPTLILKIEQSLALAMMATNKVAEEEDRQVLKPESIDRLEKVLEEVRVRYPRRTGK